MKEWCVSMSSIKYDVIPRFIVLCKNTSIFHPLKNASIFCDSHRFFMLLNKTIRTVLLWKKKCSTLLGEIPIFCVLKSALFRKEILSFLLWKMHFFLIRETFSSLKERVVFNFLKGRKVFDGNVAPDPSQYFFVRSFFTRSMCSLSNAFKWNKLISIATSISLKRSENYQWK